MPLPEPKTPWPPPQLNTPVQDQRRWSAWWSGDPDKLTDVYYGQAYPTREDSFERAPMGRGITGPRQRWFWGQPTPDGEQRSKLHVPVPAEIARVSADICYANPPTITVDDKALQPVVDELLGEQAHTLLHESAESGAALGHQWLRVGIDRAVEPDGPIISQIDADAAFPSFRYGRVAEVLFVSEWDIDGAIWRHLELHSAGLIEHGVYRGDPHNIGTRMDVRELQATAHLAPHLVELLDGRRGIVTGLQRIACVGISNQRTIAWRNNPAAKDWGRPDIAGVEQMFDAIDDTWTSWMRDLRHGRSRIHIPNTYLRSAGPGRGAVADIDRELYVGLQVPPGEKGMELTATQFAIRWQEHQQTFLALLERAYGGSGYSPQTFGLNETTALTAAESNQRAVRTGWTRSGKLRRQKMGIIRLTRLTMEMQGVHFGGPVQNASKLGVQVRFPETVTETQAARAQAAQLYQAARAMSIETLVKLAQPDLDETAHQQEVDRIKAEDAAAMPPSPLDEFADAEDSGGSGEGPDDGDGPPRSGRPDGPPSGGRP